MFAGSLNNSEIFGRRALKFLLNQSPIPGSGTELKSWLRVSAYARNSRFSISLSSFVGAGVLTENNYATIEARKNKPPAQAIIAESGPGMIERWCNFQSRMHNTFIQRNDTVDLNKLSCLATSLSKHIYVENIYYYVSQTISLGIQSDYLWSSSNNFHNDTLTLYRYR